MWITKLLPVIHILSDRLPDARTKAPSSNYASIINALDARFILISNGTYERHIFPKMEQGPKESMGEFIVLLKKQESLCDEDDVTVEILFVDQIVEKGEIV